jgi:hypothetical protein
MSSIPTDNQVYPSSGPMRLDIHAGVGRAMKEFHRGGIFVIALPVRRVYIGGARISYDQWMSDSSREVAGSAKSNVR